jgi:hypothetical protein
MHEMTSVKVNFLIKGMVRKREFTLLLDERNAREIYID